MVNDKLFKQIRDIPSIASTSNLYSAIVARLLMKKLKIGGSICSYFLAESSRNCGTCEILFNNGWRLWLQQFEDHENIFVSGDCLGVCCSIDSNGNFGDGNSGTYADTELLVKIFANVNSTKPPEIDLDPSECF